MNRPGVVLALGVFFVLAYHFLLKPQFSYQLAKSTITSGISSECRGNEKCMERFKPYLAHIDKCFTFKTATAIGTQTEGEEKIRAELCLQQEFLKDKCENDIPCINLIDLHFEGCFRNTLVEQGSPPNPIKLKAAMLCLKEKMGESIFLKIYRY